MAAKRRRFLEELRQNTVNCSSVQLREKKTNNNNGSAELQSPHENSEYTHDYGSRKEVDEELCMKHTSQFNLHEDLYLSDDSVKDPDYEQPDHVLRELDTEIMDTFSDSDKEESILQVIAQAQIHVTSPFKELNESFSILREDIQNDLFNTEKLIETSDNVQSTVQVVTSDQIHVSSPSEHQVEIYSILRVDTNSVDFRAVNNNPSENIVRNPIDTVAERAKK